MRFYNNAKVDIERILDAEKDKLENLLAIEQRTQERLPEAFKDNT